MLVAVPTHLSAIFVCENQRRRLKYGRLSALYRNGRISSIRSSGNFMKWNQQLSELASLSDCNRTRTPDHLVHKQIRNHLAKYILTKSSLAKSLSVRLWTRWFWVISHCYQSLVSCCGSSVISIFVHVKM